MSPAGAGWHVERARGTAAELHTRPEPTPARRTVRVLEVTGPAIVLGSTQSDEVVDRSRALDAGVAVTRRRSGGGAVLLVPGAHLWLDLLVPAGDPLWLDDVVAAADWVGDTWRRALASTGHDDLTVHRGRLEAAPWSDLVCFAGRGPGEVFAGGRKLVGLSQRRTREWIRVQTAVHRVWEPARMLDVLAVTPDDRVRGARELASVAAASEVPSDRLLDAVVAALPA